MTLALFVSSLPQGARARSIFASRRASHVLIGKKESFKVAECVHAVSSFPLSRAGNKGGEATRRIPMRDLFCADNYLAAARPPAHTHTNFAPRGFMVFLCAAKCNFYMPAQESLPASEHSM